MDDWMWLHLDYNITEQSCNWMNWKSVLKCHRHQKRTITKIHNNNDISHNCLKNSIKKCPVKRIKQKWLYKTLSVVSLCVFSICPSRWGTLFVWPKMRRFLLTWCCCRQIVQMAPVTSPQPALMERPTLRCVCVSDGFGRICENVYGVKTFNRQTNLNQ